MLETRIRVPIVALAAALALPLLASGERPRPGEEGVEDRPIAVASDGYVGSDACVECHASEHASWHGSYHRSMTRVAGPDTIVPSFDGVELRWMDDTVELERRGDAFLARMEDPDWRGAGPAPRIEREIQLVTGSHHMQVFWVATGDGRRLLQMPFTYDLIQERWLPDHATFLTPPPPTDAKLWDVSGTARWSGHCVKCHATHGKPRFELPGMRVADTRVSEFGIACEACHGPAEGHVRMHRERKREVTPETIVRPDRLSQAREAEVCGQCHSIFGMDNRTTLDWNENGFRFRPGAELAETKDVLRMGAHSYGGFDDATSFWSDGMVRVSGREYNGLIESPCYAAGAMTCLSCHTMHPPADDPRPLAEWADDQLALGMEGDAACLQCHPKIGESLEAHTHHAPESAGSRCYDCHMPHTSYGLLKAIRSHEIDVPTVQASVETGRPNACNQCHLDKTLAWTAAALEEWFGTPVPDLDEDERTVAASVLWTLRGDAGQRALMAWSLGWEPAQAASGTDWMLPYFARLLADPYDAVRYIAERSIRTLPEFEDFSYDFAGERAAIEAGVRPVMEAARARRTVRDPALLFDERGRLATKRFFELLGERDGEPVRLEE